MDTSKVIWITIGFIGQGLFTGRFLIQWIYSEKKRKSIIPTAFWYFSLAGGVTLLAYAIHRKDPVFIAGQATGVVVYVRNLTLISKERKRLRMQATDGAEGRTTHHRCAWHLFFAAAFRASACIPRFGTR